MSKRTFVLPVDYQNMPLGERQRIRESIDDFFRGYPAVKVRLSPTTPMDNIPFIMRTRWFAMQYLLFSVDPHVAAVLERSGEKSSKRLVWVWTTH